MTVKLDDLIFYKPNYLSQDDCEFLIEEYENRKEQAVGEQCLHANTGLLTQSTFKRHELIPGTAAYNIISNATGALIDEYLKYLEPMGVHSKNFANGLTYPHMLRLMKYEEGQWIHPHIDHDAFEAGSCTFNLNSDYEGGDFSFWNGKKKYKLGTGDALIFPAGYFFIHEVETITKGTRYSTNMFLQSIPQHIKMNAYDNVDFMMEIGGFKRQGNY
jgi:hypothetical protein